MTSGLRFHAVTPTSARVVLRLLAVCVIAAASACGGGSGKDFQLTNGALVHVDGSGTLTIAANGKTIFATAPGMAITARTFVLDVAQLNGFYQFSRTNETRVPIRKLVGSQFDGTSVEVQYVEGTRAASVRIRPGTTSGTTEIGIRVDGVDALGSVAVPLRCDARSSFLGFGAQYNGTDQRGEAFELFTSEQGLKRDGLLFGLSGDRHTTDLPMPYFLDARGFGLAVQTSARVLVDLCATDAKVAWLEVERDAPVELVVFHGPTPADVVRQVGDVFGRPKPIPDWAFGPWMAIQGGQTAVLAEADALDAANVPYTALWAQDWVGLRNFATGLSGVHYRWVPDTTAYPDLAAMTANLHGRGKRFLAYANPFVQELLEHWGPMSAQSLLIMDVDGSPYRFLGPAGTTDGNASLPDLTNAEARTYVRGFLDTMVTDYGFDGWMCDFGEWLPLDSHLSDGSDPMYEHNLYPAAWHSLHRELLEERRPTNDFALFSRSGWIGTQGTAQIVWIGDQETDWSDTDGLPTVVPALLNLGLSGVPFVTHDVGGFSSLPGEPPRSKELFMRWTELGAFTTIMRTHEGLKRADNWRWSSDAETTDHFRKLVRVHQALSPRFHALVAEAASTSIPPLRHLVLVFPDDPEAATIDDEFLVGNDLLVAPVVVEGALTRHLYLPAGLWYHAFTGVAYDGGKYVDVDAPLGTPPAFFRNVDDPTLRNAANAP